MNKNFGTKPSTTSPAKPAQAPTTSVAAAGTNRPTHNLVFKGEGAEKFTKLAGLWLNEKGYLAGKTGAEGITIPANTRFCIFENTEVKN